MNDGTHQSQDTGTAQSEPHYWSMEHYGFDDEPSATTAAGPRARESRVASRTMRIGHGRRLVVAAGALLAVLFTGTGAYAAVHAAQGPQRPAVVQQDGNGPNGAGATGTDPFGGGGHRGGDSR